MQLKELKLGFWKDVLRGSSGQTPNDFKIDFPNIIKMGSNPFLTSIH